jgi:carbamoyl-phosphate synthase large subunit
MTKVLIGGAGGAPSEGVIYSLLKVPDIEVVGMGADASDLQASMAPQKHLIPYSTDPTYREKLRNLLLQERPDFIHFQNDLEIYEASKMRRTFDELGIKYLLPDHKVIDTCVHKWKTYLAFKSAGVCIPENILISSPKDLKKSFSVLTKNKKSIWLRSAEIGGGGKGAVATDNFEFAKNWIERHDGWGHFIAAELLTNETITWLSLWFEGELVVAQTRQRSGWVHGNRTLSGVTGVTKVGITTSSKQVDEIAQQSIYAVDDKPHGLYGVDMTFDFNGIPNPTEINIARFFTTIRFFTSAGLNMPELYVKTGMTGVIPELSSRINPLENGLSWIRGMDREPVLTTISEMQSFYD